MSNQARYGIYEWGAHRGVAQRLGLVVDGAGGPIHGVLDRIPVSIMRANPQSTEVVYSAILPSAAPIMFTLAEKTLGDKMSDFFHGLVSKPSGHDALDERFAVHASDPARVAALFDDDARAMLFRLAAGLQHPLVTPQMVSLRHYAMEANAFGAPRIEQTIRELVEAAHVLARSFATPTAGYR